MRAECPHCGEFYELDNKLIGREARCKECRQVFAIEPAVEIEPPDEPEAAPPPLPAAVAFRVPSLRARLAMGVGAILLVALAFSAYSSVQLLGLIERLEQEDVAAQSYYGLDEDELEQRLRADGVWVPYSEIEAHDRRELIAGGTAILIYLVFLVLLLVWKYRAYKNLESLQAPALRFSAAGAVAWYFCPIANLWKPCQAMQDIYVGSHPRGLNRAVEVGAGLVALWWGAWLLDGFVSFVVARVYDGDESLAGVRTAAMADLAVIATGALSAILTMAIIHSITRNQKLRAAMLTGNDSGTPAGLGNPYAAMH